jgi:hypothetical protein
MSYIQIVYIYFKMDPPDNPIPEVPVVPNHITVVPQMPQPMMLGPIPMGVFDPLGELVFLQQTLFNNQTMNEMFVQRMTQIYMTMGWDFPIEGIAPAPEEEINLRFLLSQQ